MSVEQESAKVSVSDDAFGWVGCVSASEDGYGAMGFENDFFAVLVVDWVSGHVFVARSLNLACPATDFARCLNLSWKEALIRRLGAFCQTHVCVTVSDRACSAQRILDATWMVVLSYGLAVAMEWMSGLGGVPAFWRCCVVTQMGVSASAFWARRVSGD